MRAARHVVSIALGLALLGGSGAADENGAVTYPVRLQPELGIATLEGIDAELAVIDEERSVDVWRTESANTTPYNEVPSATDRFDLQGDQGHDRIRIRSVRSCGELLKAFAEGFGYPTFRSDRLVTANRLAWCRVLIALKFASSSAENYLSTYSLDEAAPETLPLNVANIDAFFENGAHRILADATVRRLTWAAWRHEAYCKMAERGDWWAWFEERHGRGIVQGPADLPDVVSEAECDVPPPLQVHRLSPNATRFVEPWRPRGVTWASDHDPFESETTLTILAHGDFDGDGIEDILVKNDFKKNFLRREEQGPEFPGTPDYWGWTGYAVLSRFRDDGALIVIQTLASHGFSRF